MKEKCYGKSSYASKMVRHSLVAYKMPSAYSCKLAKSLTLMPKI